MELEEGLWGNASERNRNVCLPICFSQRRLKTPFKQLMQEWNTPSTENLKCYVFSFKIPQKLACSYE